MASFALIVILSVIGFISAYPSPEGYSSAFNFPFVTKEQWGGREARTSTPLNHPVQFVVIHHSYIPGVCLSRDECARSMRSMQNFHMNSNGWSDIGYNFAVGGEGSVYEGRGWDAVGAHAAGYNSNSIGIVLIGDFVSNLPPAVQMQTTQELIAAGVRLGYIRPNYMLIGHRQVSATECPGTRLFNEITNWNNFVRI
ncbi:hypothetical protein O3G_MSEX004633 [Manduca sexta]|uniref:Peptidoglycan-recognition protein n=1 Tax=Manduca sexta TaxID=7130 RepID=D1KRK9_MANSE|nr:peptidoglycan recognition protein 2 [Manduca sexta]KAG6446808.1 hypothetical protein O3G_MSEX004633 [Manduca sexta]KAG6446809.1 hypothetical protein O3G_MSEX004633 [Manduca sexta]KAG6446810.1 hypothetical protein O3G_MSEX004633 [Manduca sexta]KAG6446811.1 hypothetical protein O3G_MSEX004633 [Manduca sexta]